MTKPKKISKSTTKKEMMLWEVYDRRGSSKDHIGVVRAATKDDARYVAIKKYGKYSDVKKMPWGRTWMYEKVK